MKTTLLLMIIIIVFALASCSSRKLIVTDEDAYFTDDSVAAIAESPEIKSSDTSTAEANIETLNDATPPVPIEKEEPDYPKYYVGKDAYLIEGKVQVKLWVTKDGVPQRAYILKSSDKTFNKHCLQAAMKWKFKPALLQNKPVNCWVVIPFKFRIKK